MQPIGIKMNDSFEVEIKILKDGDEIVGLWENRILIKHKDGSAEFFIIQIDENGYPRIDNQTWKITKGDGEVHLTKKPSKRKKNKEIQSKDAKVITF